MASFLDSILGNNNANPANAAMPYLDQIPGTLKPYYDPYINAGKTSLGNLMGQYQSLMNPESIMKMLGSGYQQSPGYQFNMNQGMNAINSAAASGGMLGTPSHQQQAGSMASNLASQDYNNYFNNAMGLYGRGLSGQEGINQTGYSASDSLAQALAANLMNQGNMAYLGQANQNQSRGDLFGTLVGLGSSFLF